MARYSNHVTTCLHAEALRQAGLAMKPFNYLTIQPFDRSTSSWLRVYNLAIMNLTPPQLVKLITTAYQNKAGVFVKRVNAEDHIPKNITPRQKALFLFYVIQLDYATKSQQLYNGAKKMWNLNNKYFEPKVILKTTNQQLTKLLNKYLKPRYINEAVKRWKANSQTLLDLYKGNPLNIFRNTRDAIDTMNRIKKLRGFGPKIGNFFFRSIVNTFNISLARIEEISQPVDMHDVRLTHEWGFIKSKQMSQKNIKKVKEIWQKACKEAKITMNQDKNPVHGKHEPSVVQAIWLIFDRALWILGSEGVRTEDPLQDLEENLELTQRDIM